jgi:hypothetical protein
MITYEELKENGFVEDGEWNNRFYFTKNGFDIVEHCGIRRWNKQNLSGYGKNFETIEDLNEAYRKWAEKRIEKYEEYGEKIRILKESLNEKNSDVSIDDEPWRLYAINGHVVTPNELSLYNKYIDYLKGIIKINEFLDDNNTLNDFRLAKSIYERISN